MSRADKNATNASYVIEIDPETKLPVRMRVLLLTGQKGSTVIKKKRIVGGDHVAFYFDYELKDFNKSKMNVPAPARKALSKLR